MPDLTYEQLLEDSWTAYLDFCEAVQHVNDEEWVEQHELYMEKLDNLFVLHGKPRKRPNTFPS